MKLVYSPPNKLRLTLMQLSTILPISLSRLKWIVGIAVIKGKRVFFLTLIQIPFLLLEIIYPLTWE
jgi:hypothetical protein